MTRARERLILSGAARLDIWAKGHLGTPIGWLAPVLVPDIAIDQSSRVTESGVALTLLNGEGESPPPPPSPPADLPGVAAAEPIERPPPSVPGSGTGAPVTSLSYTALAEFERCGLPLVTSSACSACQRSTPTRVRRLRV